MYAIRSYYVDTLAIETARRRMFVSSLFPAHLGSKRVVDPLPGAIVTPHAEVIVHTWPFRVFFGQHPPLDAAYYNINYGINDLTHIQTARSST